jgi:signal transduction histidine kinase
MSSSSFSKNTSIYLKGLGSIFDTSHNDYLNQFIKSIKEIPDIDNFNFLGDKTFEIGSSDFHFEIQCRYQTDGDEYVLELLLNDVTRSKTIERQNAEFKYKTMFLSKVAHEFRNPLVSIAELICQSTDILENNHQRKEALHEKISQIESLSNYLLVLTKDLNYFNETEIDQSGITLEPRQTNMKEVVNFCTGITEALIHKSIKADAIDFKVNMKLTNETIITDEWRLKQILVNLLSNAVKFTPKGKIILEISDLQSDNRHLVKFSVVDTGLGISDEDHEEISNILQTKPRKKMNSGLGMIIINEIANKLGTKIEFSSVPNKGTDFWFFLDTDSIFSESMNHISENECDLNESKTTEILPTHNYNMRNKSFSQLEQIGMKKDQTDFSFNFNSEDSIIIQEDIKILKVAIN